MNKPYDQIIGAVVVLVVGCWLLGVIWPYLLGGLAIWGAFSLVSDYQRSKNRNQNNERKHHHGPRPRN